MARRPIRGSATKQDTGKSCPFCRFPIKERDEVVACGECHSPHHEDCWEENGGCAVSGCAGAPESAGSGSSSGGSHIPPVAGPSKKKVTLDPRPAMRRRKRQRQRTKPTKKPVAAAAPPGKTSKSTLWIAGAVVAFLAVVAVIMIANNFGDTDPASSKSCEEGTGLNGIPCYDNGKLPNVPTAEMEGQAGRAVRSWFNLIALGDYQRAWMSLSPRVRNQIRQDKGFQGWQENQLALNKYLEPANAVVHIVKPSYPDEGVLSVKVTNMPYTKEGDLCEKREGVTWVAWNPKKNRWFMEPGVGVSKQRKADWGYRSVELLSYKCG